MSPADRTTLGLDASTQSLSAVLLNANTGTVIWQRSLAYRDDPRLFGFGFEHDTLILPPREPGEAEQPPRLFLAALDAMCDDMKAAGIDIGSIAAINTSAQQHGHVYLNDKAPAAFQALHMPGCTSPPRLSHRCARRRIRLRRRPHMEDGQYESRSGTHPDPGRRIGRADRPRRQ